MKKRSELLFSAVRVPSDFLMLVAAAITAFFIRDIPQIIALQQKLYTFPFDQYLRVILIVIPFFLLLYAIEGLYDIRATKKPLSEIYHVFRATSIGLVIIIVAIFLKREWFSSRFIILAAWVFGVAYVAFARSILAQVQKWMLVKRGIGVHRVVLVGENSRMEQVRKTMKRKKNLGYKVVEHIPTASIKMIKELQEKKGVDEVFVCDPSLSDEEMEKLNDYCQIHNIAYRLMPTSLQTTQFSIALFGGEPVLEFHNTPLDGWGKIIKRTTDMIASTILIILVSPIMAIVALAIWIEDRKGPIVYKNERIGSNGQKFLVYKFRYMLWKHSIHKDNPHLEEAIALEKKLIRERNVRKGALYKIKDDPRKSRIGRVIERYSIDELPQLFNVWKGQMSLVGPRPHQEREVQKYREYHRRLLTIKPGITGMAQVAGRSDLDFEDEYKLDVYYIENWSLLLDIRILFRTILVLFRRRKNN